MANFVSNGWEIYFHPQLFGTQYQELFNQFSQLREKLPEAEFKTHTTVKLFAAITVVVETWVFPVKKVPRMTVMRYLLKWWREEL